MNNMSDLPGNSFLNIDSESLQSEIQNFSSKKNLKRKFDEIEKKTDNLKKSIEITHDDFEFKPKKYQKKLDENTILKDIQTNIDEQNNGIKELFNKISKKNLLDSITYTSEIIQRDEDTQATLMIRKSEEGHLEVLTNTGEAMKGAYKSVQKMESLMNGSAYALAIPLNPKYISMTLKEAEICRKIREKVGSSIINIHSIKSDSGQAAILMEYCGGGSFTSFEENLSHKREICEKNLLTGAELEKTVDIITQDAKEYLSKILAIGKILVKIHEAGYAHNDLKPDNIMFTEGGELRFIDFGLSRKFKKKASYNQRIQFDAMRYVLFLENYASYISSTRTACNKVSVEDMNPQEKLVMKNMQDHFSYGQELIQTVIEDLQKEVEDRPTIEQVLESIVKAYNVL